MAQQEDKAETSLHISTKEATTANTDNPKNDLQTAEQTIYTWKSKEDDTEKCKVAEPW